MLLPPSFTADMICSGLFVLQHTEFSSQNKADLVFFVWSGEISGMLFQFPLNIVLLDVHSFEYHFMTNLL